MMTMKSYMRHMALLLLAAAVAGCSDSEPDPAPAPSDGMPIAFGVVTGSSPVQGLKTLVGNPAKDGAALPEGVKTLSTMCTPEDKGGEGRYIALWGDKFSNTDQASARAFDQVFHATRLAYDTYDGTNPSGWNYESEEEYWSRGNTYRFRAYFPAALGFIENSSVSTLALVYNSHQVQDDAMIAYNEVDTGAAEFNPKKSVELYFRHALAAVRFNFELKYEAEDYLTACWLENSKANDFAVGGILVCEQREPGGRIFTKDNPPADSELESFFTWTYSYYPVPGADVDPFYKWVCTPYETVDSEGNSVMETGVRFKSTLDGEGGCLVDATATAYSSSVPCTSGSEMFTRNGGWLLFIPQESSGDVLLCFKTRNGGDDAVFRMKLPAETEKPKTDGEGNEVVSRSTRWRAGKRYTYTVGIDKSNMSVDLKVADWNMRYSSTQIEF